MIINLGALEYMYIRSHLNSFSNSPTFIRLRRSLYTISDYQDHTNRQNKNKQGHTITVLM